MRGREVESVGLAGYEWVTVWLEVVTIVAAVELFFGCAITQACEDSVW